MFSEDETEKRVTIWLRNIADKACLVKWGIFRSANFQPIGLNEMGVQRLVRHTPICLVNGSLALFPGANPESHEPHAAQAASAPPPVVTRPAAPCRCAGSR